MFSSSCRRFDRVLMLNLLFFGWKYVTSFQKVFQGSPVDYINITLLCTHFINFKLYIKWQLISNPVCPYKAKCSYLTCIFRSLPISVCYFVTSTLMCRWPYRCMVCRNRTFFHISGNVKNRGDNSYNFEVVKSKGKKLYHAIFSKREHKKHPHSIHISFLKIFKYLLHFGWRDLFMWCSIITYDVYLVNALFHLYWLFLHIAVLLFPLYSLIVHDIHCPQFIKCFFVFLHLAQWSTFLVLFCNKFW